nr:G protein-coupled receptor [Proales similis]
MSNSNHQRLSAVCLIAFLLNYAASESAQTENSIEDESLASVDSKLDSMEETIIICTFVALIVFGAVGNLLVIWTVLLNRSMRTTNNLFILNLATSDLTLCMFSIPFNLYKTLRHSWIFGSFLCKFAPFFQASNVFVSTFSITAIALDRYMSIVKSRQVNKTKQINNSLGSIMILVGLWMTAFLLSSPLLFFNRIQTISLDFDLNAMMENQLGNDSMDVSELESLGDSVLAQSASSSSSDDLSVRLRIHHCIENSPFNQSRLIYSYVSLLIQYVLPILIVGIAYGSIWWKLKKQKEKLRTHTLSKRKRPDGTDAIDNSQAPSQAPTRNNALRAERSRQLKMNILLSFIAIIFAVSWLPLNIFNILSDSKLSIIKADHSFYVINAVCILFAMSSALSNPLLYGFLNENFKREYKRIFNSLIDRVKRCIGIDKKPLQSENPAGDAAVSRRYVGSSRNGSVALLAPESQILISPQTNQV